MFWCCCGAGGGTVLQVRNNDGSLRWSKTVNEMPTDDSGSYVGGFMICDPFAVYFFNQFTQVTFGSGAGATTRTYAWQVTKFSGSDGSVAWQVQYTLPDFGFPAPSSTPGISDTHMLSMIGKTQLHDATGGPVGETTIIESGFPQITHNRLWRLNPSNGALLWNITPPVALGTLGPGLNGELLACDSRIRRFSGGGTILSDEVPSLVNRFGGSLGSDQIIGTSIGQCRWICGADTGSLPAYPGTNSNQIVACVETFGPGNIGEVILCWSYSAYQDTVADDGGLINDRNPMSTATNPQRSRSRAYARAHRTLGTARDSTNPSTDFCEITSGYRANKYFASTGDAMHTPTDSHAIATDAYHWIVTADHLTGLYDAVRFTPTDGINDIPDPWDDPVGFQWIDGSPVEVSADCGNDFVALFHGETEIQTQSASVPGSHTGPGLSPT